jgi:hypothetical protein
MRRATSFSPSPTLVGANIDTFIGNVKTDADFPLERAAQLDRLTGESQEADEVYPTSLSFAGETVSGGGFPPVGLNLAGVLLMRA